MWKLYINIGGNKYPVLMESPYNTKEEVREAMVTLQQIKSGYFALESGDWIAFNNNQQFYFTVEKVE